MPAIRLGGEAEPFPDGGGRGKTARLRSLEVEVGGVPTRALSAKGEGVPSVLLHGWLDNADTWLAVLDRLAVAQRPAIAYDLPGFGTAPPLDDSPVLDQLVDFAAAAVEEAAERSGRKVVVAGNSLGGWVALRLAERSDLPLAGIVPIAPAGLQTPRWFEIIERDPLVRTLLALPVPIPRAVLMRAIGEAYRRLAFSRPALADGAVVEMFAAHHAHREGARRLLENGRRLLPELIAGPFDLEAIECPVMLVWGTRDRMVPHTGARRLIAALPETRVEMLEGVGHCPQLEATDVLLELLGAFPARSAVRAA
jgi:pimeloyl-ACP methyl ester carboxylesterase